MALAATLFSPKINIHNLLIYYAHSLYIAAVSYVHVVTCVYFRSTLSLNGLTDFHINWDS